jgi:putative CocE/NonD family hydrolase
MFQLGLIALLLVGAPPATAAGKDEQVLVERNVAVPMRDGTVLRADVYRPSGDGPFPVLVHRTPYQKSAKHSGMTKYGFIVVSQDARGRYASDGEFESLNRFESHDAADGRDTIDWAAKLPGSNGNVGTLGVSYDAFLQWRATSAQPPSLKAMAAFSIPAKYTDLEMPGTVRPGRRWEWWYTNAADMNKRDGGPPPHTKAEAKKLWDEGEGERVMNTVAWLNLPDSLFGHEAAAMKDWLRRPWLDPWKLDEDAARATVPNLNVCGWYDHCNGSIDLHTAITKRGATEAARRHSKLIVGPWSHNALGKRKQGTVDFGPEAQIDFDALQAKWFAHWLKGDAKDDFAALPPVRLFVMGVGEWRDYETWPVPGAKPQAFYLTGDGGANTPKGDGRLVDSTPPREASDSYDYDPRDPVPTLWSNGATFTVAAEQSPLADRRDILVYQTEPLAAPIDAIGYPETVLFASSSRPDADFFARLIDVAPDGRAIDVTHGMVRARHRESLEKVTLLTPGETVEFQIKMRPTAHRFLPGHRIRLDVTSSDYPSYDRNHSTAADPNVDAELVAATQTVRHGGKFASRLILPTLEVRD